MTLPRCDQDGETALPMLGTRIGQVVARKRPVPAEILGIAKDTIRKQYEQERDSKPAKMLRQNRIRSVDGGSANFSKTPLTTLSTCKGIDRVIYLLQRGIKQYAAKMI